MKEKVLNRKRRAVRRLGLLVSVLCLGMSLAGYNSGPRMAVSDAADELDMAYEKTFIKGFYDAGDPEHFLSLKYLVETREAMMFCSVYLTPFGWVDGQARRVETWEGQAANAGLMSFYGDEEHTHWLFGRMEEKPTSITLYYEEEVDQVTHRFGIEVPAEHLFRGENGTWYLLSQVRTDWVEQESAEGFEGPREFGLLLSKDGEKIADVEVKR